MEEGPFAILGVCLSGFTALQPYIEKRKKKREVIDTLVNALGEDIRLYKTTFDDLSQISDDLLIPSLEAFKVESGSSKEKVNAIIASVTEMYIAYDKLINLFVKLSEECKGITINSAFMKDLMEYNSFVHDYVSQMARMTTGKNSVKIDKDFYLFIRMHENKTFEKLKDKKVDDAVEKLEKYIELVNKQVKPFISKSTITRVNQKRFIDSWKGLAKDAKKIKISKELLNNFEDYMPSKFAPLAVVYENIFPKRESEEKLRYRGHQKS